MDVRSSPQEIPKSSTTADEGISKMKTDIGNSRQPGNHVPDGCLLRHLPLLVICLLAVLYGATVVPFPWPSDPAEFVVAAATLGIAHPTGYPLYVILGHSVLTLCRINNPALVMNALSSVYLLAALGLLAGLMRRVGISSGVAAGTIAKDRRTVRRLI